MSVDQARRLVKRVHEDPEFLGRLDDAPHEDKRAILADEGYGDVGLRDLSQALPNSSGGELSDDEFASAVGAGTTSTGTSAVISASVGAASAAGVA